MISDEDDFLIRPTRSGTREPAPTGGSWWMGLQRSEFYAEIATRFAVNKAESATPGLATWTKAIKPKEAA